MAKIKPAPSSEDIVVLDLNMACAYYACVFDAEAEAEEEGGREERVMRIGDRSYRLVRSKAAEADEAPHCAIVEDVDVSIARVAVKGGKIIACASRAADGAREGRVRDPFGHTWLVRTHA